MSEYEYEEDREDQDYDEEDYDEYRESKEERGVGERTQQRHVFIDAENDAEKDARLKTPLEHFTTNIRKVSEKILVNIYLDTRIFNKNDVTQIISNIHLFSKPECKNPTCFVLGYIATVGGQNINYDILSKLYKIIDKIDETKNIKDADIIRYCTLWINTV